VQAVPIHVRTFRLFSNRTRLIGNRPKKEEEASVNDVIQRLSAVDCISWCVYNKLMVREGIPFSLDGTPYLVDLVHRRERVVHIKKGAQVRCTTLKFLEQVHACLYGRYKQNVLYMMPTVKQVEALSRISFDPLLDCNLWLRRYVSVNTAALKTIAGRSIYFVGAQPQRVGGTNTKDSPSLRSIPCDCVLRDELDLMDEDMVELSRQRIRDSELKLECNFASPTYPGYGIDACYERSTQYKWHIKCRSCGRHTCLVEHFPDSIRRVDGRWRRSCVHCGAEVFVQDGHWEADYPDRPEAGFWVDGLLSPRADLEADMLRYHNSEGAARCEFMRSVLGIASVEANNQLTDKDIYERCCLDLMQYTSSVDTVMGADVGDVLHYVVGVRTGTEHYTVLRVGTAEDFGHLHEVAKQMRVKLCVLDAMPDIHASRKFQREEPYTVYRCHYSEQMPGEPKFDAKTGVVKCNRNEMCDKVYDLFASSRIRIPRLSGDIKEYARQMTQTAKTLITNPDTGLAKPKWVKLGDDHYFHATLYFLLACMRSSVVSLSDGHPSVRRFRRVKNTFYV